MQIGGYFFPSILPLFTILFLPIVFIYITKGNFSYKMFIFLLSLSFFEGHLELVGISLMNSRIMETILIIILYFKMISERNKKFFPYILTLFLIITITLFSAMVNNNSIINLSLFLWRFLFFFGIIYILINISISENSIKNLLKFIKYLFVFQLFLIIPKLLLIGVAEHYIGSMSNLAGSLTTLFVLVGIVYLFIKYLSSDRNIYLFYMLLFLLFGIIGMKRAIIVYIPLILITLYIIYSYKKKYIINIKLALVVLISLTIIMLITILNPTLNPSGTFGGVFNFDFLLEYSNEYLIVRNDRYVGRFLAPALTFDILSNTSKVLLFGFGPGSIIASNLNNSIYASDELLLFHKFGLGYGARTGIIWVVMQIGIIASILFIYILIGVLRHFIKYYNNSKNKISSNYYLLGIGIMFIIINDFLFYSQSYVIPNAILITSYMIVGLVYRQHYLKFQVKL